MIIQEALYNQVLVKHERYMAFVALMDAEIQEKRKGHWLPFVNSSKASWQSALNKFHAQSHQWSNQLAVPLNHASAFAASGDGL